LIPGRLQLHTVFEYLVVLWILGIPTQAGFWSGLAVGPAVNGREVIIEANSFLNVISLVAIFSRIFHSKNLEVHTMPPIIYSKHDPSPKSRVLQAVAHRKRSDNKSSASVTTGGSGTRATGTLGRGAAVVGGTANCSVGVFSAG
jgi:hypothetical protein